MAAPSRGQINTTYILSHYKVELYNLSNTWVEIASAHVVALSGNIDSTANVNNGIAFGSPATTSADVDVEEYLVDGTYYISDPVWMNRNIRISFAYDDSDYVQLFFGPITRINKSNNTVKLSMAGVEQHLSDLKIHTPIYYRRLVATKTTSSSEENPANSGYTAGLLNYAFWQAGGRPWEQNGIFFSEASTGFKFWYSCDFSILAPEYSWFSGDNTLDEVYALVRAAGGQIYQDSLGVLRYTQPMSFGDTTDYGGTYYTIDDSMFVDFSHNVTHVEKVETLKLTYTPRVIAPEQEVINDATKRFFLPSETKVIELSPQQPIWSYVGIISGDNTTATNTMHAFLLNNQIVTPTIGTITTNAASISITVTNPSSTVPMILYNITIKGRPLVAKDELNLSYGSGSVERILENNVYIQSEAHALRYLQMIYDFYVQNKPIITLNGMIFDVDRTVGELVKVDSNYNNNDPGTLYRIIKIGHNIGTSMDVDLVNITTIYNRTDIFIVGTSYSDGDVKRLGY